MRPWANADWKTFEPERPEERHERVGAAAGHAAEHAGRDRGRDRRGDEARREPADPDREEPGVVAAPGPAYDQDADDDAR